MLEYLVPLSIGKLIYDMYESDKLDEQAKATSLKAMNRMEEARAEQCRKAEEAKQNILRLANRKKGILSSSMTTFVTVYEQLKKIELTVSDGIDELADLPATFVQEIHNQITFVGNPLNTQETVITYIFEGLGSVIKKDSQRNLDMAQIRAKQARAITAQANTINLAYEAVSERANRITDVLTKINLLFVKSLLHTKKIIEKNGTSKNNYSRSERESLATCINLAKAVKSIIDTTLLDEAGELTVQSMEAIYAGEQYLHQIEHAMK